MKPQRKLRDITTDPKASSKKAVILKIINNTPDSLLSFQIPGDMKLTEITHSFLHGDNKAFEYIYLKHGSYCIDRLISKRGCSNDDARDLFIDAVLIFRRKILNGEISYLTRLDYYLYRTCENNYLANLKKEASKSKHEYNIEQFLYAESEEMSVAQKESGKISWNKLSEKCKNMIYLFYVKSISMEDIATQMGLSNADSAKSTKSRCMKKYISEARKHYNKIKDVVE